MALQFLYQGREVSQNKNQAIYKQTLYGKLQQIDQLISGFQIGYRDQEKGYLRSWTKTQKEADIWQVEIEYTKEFDFSFSDQDESVVGKKSAQLSVRNIQMPLESSANYRTNWNYYLAGKGEGNIVTTPYWWETADTIIIDIADRENYMWIKSLGELPLEKDQNGVYWQILEQPTKPGVQYYDLACFVVTISAKYRSASAAGNAISKKINCITSPPQDFNLGGEWKLDECSVSYDGKAWIATETYTRAVDYWDPQLYGN